MDLSIEECTSHIYEEDIDKALFHIFNALKVLEVILQLLMLRQLSAWSTSSKLKLKTPARYRSTNSCSSTVSSSSTTSAPAINGNIEISLFIFS